ncbi:enoyl-CoA hydratase [Rhodococcus rhodochrous]|uniref:enoyl-CoA hydratase/isomerase family protein n=1 Tax=Rhodococcus TaxID=1827 RepID=UPI00075098AA|nr:MULTISPECIES: enoyl-CoA hydratase/isomerase family protein [Rhodococcus]MDO1486847.1 enoyl-CoA hydratase/isomerase family protein [Rhodococcus rhodochrous]OBA37867.1 epimerase [Rhodococcus sp. 852002-51564_SCH6189132-a]QQM53105.1 enoyl-CoA hydratase/isomerase family protein [Rhodococcus pyridinivorans]SNV28480.1 enoyl-CoA hydratase [Rhodococcus rhodochrous]
MSTTEVGTTSMKCEILSGGVALVEFSQAHEQNPFSRARMRELTQLMLDLDGNDEVRCVVLYGGAGRSFGAGGDFNEVSEFSGGDEVDAWIDDITDLYSTIAGISKPVVAAIDGFAIGVGLQIALCCDLRIGSSVSKLVMPEFKVGIACNFGGYMLETVVGRSVMQDMLYTCAEWPADRALADRLLHEVTAPEELLDRAVEHGRRIARYTVAAVQSTRARVNGPYVQGLRRVREEGKRSHRTAFSAGEAQQRMRRIIGKG